MMSLRKAIAGAARVASKAGVTAVPVPARALSSSTAGLTTAEIIADLPKEVRSSPRKRHYFAMTYY